MNKKIVLLSLAALASIASVGFAQSRSSFGRGKVRQPVTLLDPFTLQTVAVQPGGVIVMAAGRPPFAVRPPFRPPTRSPYRPPGRGPFFP